MAIGGKSASKLYEDEKKFDIMVRYITRLSGIMRRASENTGTASNGAMIPIKELAHIYTLTGPLIYRDNNVRYCAVKFSVRDAMSAVAEAQAKVNKQVKLPEGYRLKWAGDLKPATATKRLAQVVPVS